MAVPSFCAGSSASTSPLVSILGLEWAKIQTGHRCHPVSAAILLELDLELGVSKQGQAWKHCKVGRFV